MKELGRKFLPFFMTRKPKFRVNQLVVCFGRVHAVSGIRISKQSIRYDLEGLNGFTSSVNEDDIAKATRADITRVTNQLTDIKEETKSELEELKKKHNIESNNTRVEYRKSAKLAHSFNHRLTKIKAVVVPPQQP